MMAEQTDKTGPEYQRMTWDALKKSINGLVNKVNASNIKNILPELFSENMIRGRGLFARSVMKSQMASPHFSAIFAALVAVVNTKFPELGELGIGHGMVRVVVSREHLGDPGTAGRHPLDHGFHLRRIHHGCLAGGLAAAGQRRDLASHEVGGGDREKPRAHDHAGHPLGSELGHHREADWR